MILLFGGTTEGRQAVETLEAAGTPYYYSTKTGEQDVALHNGVRIDGALDESAMRAFCLSHDVRLLVDAAHPFAERLHMTVAAVAASLGMPAIRMERIFPDRDESLEWFDGIEAFVAAMQQRADRPRRLMATTGVQSIARLKPLEQLGLQMRYRILPRESSVAHALSQGATREQLCYYHEGENELDVLTQLKPEAILLKESGLTGGYAEKVAAAKELGIGVFVIRRPPTPGYFVTVNGDNGLRRMVEKLLPSFYPLHSGLTTGTCATAAAVAATLQRCLRTKANEEQSVTNHELPQSVPVILPNGETIQVPVSYGDGYASCVKEAGDDPDVTNGLEIRATVEIENGLEMPAATPVSSGEEGGGCQIEILGGEGVGVFSLPGFDFPPGSPAINKAPREMIRRNLMAIANQQSAMINHQSSISVTISVPRGREVASRTFNPRLGIEGGISIIGVSGIVKPFSEEAFIESIHKCMEVAKASGSDRVVINSGAKSERFLRAYYPDLPRQAFVEYGNYIAETLRMADELRIPNVTLGIMLGKAVKLAAGNLDTHSRRVTMDKAFISQMLREAAINLDISQLTLARELWTLIPPESIGAFVSVVIAHCEQHCRPLLAYSTLTILLIDDDGKIMK